MRASSTLVRVRARVSATPTPTPTPTPNPNQLLRSQTLAAFGVDMDKDRLCISPVSPLYLPCVSHVSPVYLPTSPLYRPTSPPQDRLLVEEAKYNRRGGAATAELLAAGEAGGEVSSGPEHGFFLTDLAGEMAGDTAGDMAGDQRDPVADAPAGRADYRADEYASRAREIAQLAQSGVGT